MDHTSTSSSTAKNFLEKVNQDFRNKESWKLKAVYFFLLSGIVIMWAQFTIHQSSLELTDRDISDFSGVNSILTIFLPFAAGFVADKTGNYSFILYVMMIFMGINSFFFVLIPPVVKNGDSECIAQSRSPETLIKERLDAFYSVKKDNLASCFESINSTTFNYSLITNFSRFCEEIESINRFFSDLSIIDVPSRLDCFENSTLDAHSYEITYWSYFAVKTSFMLLTTASFTLFDSAVMALSKEKNIDYGLQRAWGTLAALISAYVGGILVDFYSEGKIVKDFTLMFFGSGVCCILAGICMSLVNIDFKIPATNYSKEFLNDLKSFQTVSLLLLIIFKGCFMGFAETFMYLHMSQLGASSTLIGLTVTIGASFEVLLQFFASPITKNIGRTSVISIGILCYAARFIGFAYASHPETMLGLEILDSWASGLTNTVINMYVTVLSTPGTIASMRGLIGALDSGIGKYIGAKAGIKIRERYGNRKSWIIMAVWALFVALIFAVSLKVFKAVQRKCQFRRQTSANLYSMPVNKIKELY